MSKTSMPLCTSSHLNWKPVAHLLHSIALYLTTVTSRLCHPILRFTQHSPVVLAFVKAKESSQSYLARCRVCYWARLNDAVASPPIPAIHNCAYGNVRLARYPSVIVEYGVLCALHRLTSVVGCYPVDLLVDVDVTTRLDGCGVLSEEGTTRVNSVRGHGSGKA